MKRCLVNLVTNELRFTKAQDRLIERMKGQDIPLVAFRGTDSVGAPTHKSNPFAFKIYAIEAARQMGYEQVFWVDSCVYPVYNIDPVFERLDKFGIFLEDSGHRCGAWVMQETLDYFGISRMRAEEMKMISAGFIGLDFYRRESIEFFKFWSKAMQDGMFRGDTVKYRSEQGAASIIANLLCLEEGFSEPHQYFCYVGESYPQNNGAPFLCQGF